VIWVGARDPEDVAITITDADFDLSLVTDVEIDVRLRNNPERVITWTWWTIEDATETSLTLVHVFAEDGSEVPVPGTYVVSGWLVTPSTRRRMRAVTIAATEYGT
jgi:hypothetical protein